MHPTRLRTRPRLQTDECELFDVTVYNTNGQPTPLSAICQQVRRGRSDGARHYAGMGRTSQPQRRSCWAAPRCRFSARGEEPRLSAFLLGPPLCRM